MQKSNYEKLLTEDDCAPDARWHFLGEMKKKFGLTMDDFGGDISDDDFYIVKQTTDGFYKLEMSADYPFFTLYKKVGVEKP